MFKKSAPENWRFICLLIKDILLEDKDIDEIDNNDLLKLLGNNTDCQYFRFLQNGRHRAIVKMNHLMVLTHTAIQNLVLNL